MHPDAGNDVPPDLARWGLHAFALGARTTPHAIVRLDDNGALLYQARNGVTPAELEARGITASQSQLKLLETYGLITVDGDRITTAFPVVGPEVLDSLRPRIRQLAADLADRISGDVQAITAELRRRGHAGHDYTVVFGHAVDGLLWDQLRVHDLVPSTELSIERPFWNGAFWAIYPPVAGGAGVNELTRDDATLIMVWTEATSGALWELARSEAMEQVLADPTGQTTIPVLVANKSDGLHRHSQNIAETIARAFTTDPQARALLEAIPNADPHQRTLILTHELIWDLMGALLAAGLLPPLPGNNRGAEPHNLNEHLLLRLKPRRGTARITRIDDPATSVYGTPTELLALANLLRQGEGTMVLNDMDRDDLHDQEVLYSTVSVVSVPSAETMWTKREGDSITFVGGPDCLQIFAEEIQDHAGETTTHPCLEYEWFPGYQIERESLPMYVNRESAGRPNGSP